MLYLAVSDEAYETILFEPGTPAVIEDRAASIVTFNVEREEIVKWMK